MDVQVEGSNGRVHQLVAFELGLCCSVANVVVNRLVIAVFRTASKIGDWPLSVSVGIILLSLHGWAAIGAWTVASLTAVVVQKTLKNRYGRKRPCERSAGPPQRAPIPDHGSFPSGHTLHAVMAAVVVSVLAGPVAPLFIVLAILVGLSRVVLGVHYPSDVAAGAALGAIFGELLLLTL
jgi:undecaprenyl-diphosphatase